MKSLTSLTSATLLTLALITPQHLQAQPYPSKPVRLIVPYAPGGATDIISRASAIELSKTLGQSVVVDNRPGAGGNVGAEMAAKSAPDGYTMLMSASSLHGITPFLYSKLSYDPNKDLAPVIVFASFANVLVLNPGVKANSLKELIALVKAQPGKLACASSGSGSTIHMSCEMFKQMLGLDITHVPYRGSGPALTDLLGGQVSMIFAQVPSVMPHIQSGKLRALGVASARRIGVLPAVPTIAEAVGLAGFEAVSWYALVGPAGMPASIVNKIQADVARVLQLPDIREKLLALGADPVGSNPEQLLAAMRADFERYGSVIRKVGIKSE